MKTCSKCREKRPTSEFNKDKNTKDGLDLQCRHCRKAYREANKEKIAERTKSYYLKNRERILDYQRTYSAENKLKKSEKNKKYQRENRSKIAASRMKRRQSDDSHRLAHNLGCRISTVMRGKGKASGTKDLIGCTTEELWLHLEAQFTEGMTRENYGEWHVDHIRPCASFDLTCPEQQRECFHYSNLQPLWAEDNLKKSDNWG